MIDVPENIKELIDSTVKEQFAAFEKMVNGNGDKNNGNKGVSDPVKHYLNDLQNNPFAGKDI